MRFMKQKIMASAAIAALGIQGAAAQTAEGQAGNGESPGSFDLEVSAGAEYDSNISVEQLESSTGTGDIAGVFDADAEYEHAFTDKTSASVGYAFSQSLHEDLTDFDLQTHHASVGVQREFDPVEVGADYHYVYTRLGGDGFLTYQNLSPYVAGFVSDSLYVRAAYTYVDKGFKNRDDRDANSHGGGADLFWFIDGVRTYVLTGYQYEKEDAVLNRYDYNAHNLKAQLTKRLSAFGRELTGKVGWRFEKRNYTDVTPSIGVNRDDDRHRFQAEVEVPITDRVYSLAEYEYADYASNLPSADYTQHFVGVRVGFRL